MTREEAKKAAEVMIAYAEGKEIEYYSKASNEWKSCNNCYFNWEGDVKYSYRIKTQPTYRPFANAEECWQEMQKHQPFGWVKSKNNNDIYCLSAVEDCGIITYLGDWEYDLAEDRITFADGEPFGVKEDAE